MICKRWWRSWGIPLGWGKRPCDDLEADQERLGAELERATADQVEAMRTLTAFRRQYHDGTGAVAVEAQKLRREVARLKTAITKVERKGGK